MTRETKVGLLVGFAVIMMTGVLVSNFMVDVKEPARQMTSFGPQTNQSIAPFAPQGQLRDDGAVVGVPDSADVQQGVIFLPGEDPNDNGQRQEIYVEPPPHSAVATRERSHEESQHPQLTYAEPERPSFFDQFISDIRSNQTNNNTIPPQRPTAQQTTQDARDTQYVDERGRVVGDTRSRHERRNNEVVVIDDRVTEAQGNTPADTRVFHKVTGGETLYHIAKRYYGDGEKWREISNANPTMVNDKGHVREGDKLIIPGLQREAPRTASNDNTRNRTTNNAPGEITVQANDSLSTLARRHLGDDSRWIDLFEANKDRLPDPDHVTVGMKLRLPPRESQNVAEAPRERPVVLQMNPSPRAANDNTATSNQDQNRRDTRPLANEPKTYVVKSGDSLTSIARKMMGHDRHYIALYEANQDKLASMDDIKAGQKLIIPKVD